MKPEDMKIRVTGDRNCAHVEMSIINEFAADMIAALKECFLLEMLAAQVNHGDTHTEVEFDIEGAEKAARFRNFVLSSTPNQQSILVKNEN